MRALILITYLAFLCASQALSQSADNLVLQGRAFLVGRDITNANARFRAAVVASPDHQSANALHAASRLLSYPYTPGAQAMLDRLGFELTNRTIYAWKSSPPQDTNGIPVPPNDFSVAEAMTFLSTNLLPEIEGAAANLAKVRDPNFILRLSTNETQAGAVTVDYPDILMLRALVHASEFLVHYLRSLDLDAQLNALYGMHERGSLSPRSLLEGFPTLLTYADKTQLPEARTAFQSAANRYLEASELIRTRPTNTVRLFNMDRGSAEDEAAFRKNLLELLGSLSTTTGLTVPTNSFQNLEVNLGHFFQGTVSPRGGLPTFWGDGILLGTLPDATMGGAVFGLSEGMFYEAISEGTGMPLLPVIVPPGQPQLRVHVVDGREYAVQISTDLKNWSESSIIHGSGGVAVTPSPSMAPGQGVFLRVQDISMMARFAGRVVDAQTGAGLAGANVGSSLDQTTTTTDATGAFLLRTRYATKSVGSFILTASAAGYGPMTLGGYARSSEVGDLVLLAHRPPTITQQPADVVVRTGSSASFTVVAAANPPPTYSWRKGATPVGGNSSTLTIPAVKASDAGVYSVTVTSAGGSTTSREARLTVSPN